MGLRVQWDSEKARQNLFKHGVSFEEAVTALADPLSVSLSDPDHSAEEDRLLVLGRANTGRYLIVSITERGDDIRVISARIMTSRERRTYERSLDP